MTVKIRCYVKCRVPEPILDGFHGLSVCKQKAGTTVTQIMEPKPSETILVHINFGYGMTAFLCAADKRISKQI